MQGQGHGSMYKSKMENLPESKISEPVLLRNRHPIFLIDLEGMCWHGECINERCWTHAEMAYRSVIQCPKAFAIIRADSSIHSLFCPLYFAWKSAYFHNLSLNGLIFVDWNWHPSLDLWDPAILRTRLAMSNHGSQWRTSRIICRIVQKIIIWEPVRRLTIQTAILPWTPQCSVSLPRVCRPRHTGLQYRPKEVAYIPHIGPTSYAVRGTSERYSLRAGAYRGISKFLH